MLNISRTAFLHMLNALLSAFNNASADSSSKICFSAWECKTEHLSEMLSSNCAFSWDHLSALHSCHESLTKEAAGLRCLRCCTLKPLLEIAPEASNSPLALICIKLCEFPLVCNTGRVGTEGCCLFIIY